MIVSTYRNYSKLLPVCLGFNPVTWSFFVFVLLTCFCGDVVAGGADALFVLGLHGKGEVLAAG